MTRRSSKGAAPGVQRALGWTNGVANDAVRTEIAPCVLCGAHLRFATGEYGQTLEICTSGTCPGRRPHAPRPSHTTPIRVRRR